MFYICFDQMQNNLISQSAQMETGKTPNDMLSAMNQVGCILFTPFIQHVVYPLLHKRHIYIKPITRITIGFCFVVLSMTCAAIVQNRIYSSGPCYTHPRECSLVTNHEPNRISVWIQTPVFLLIAMGEVWAYVTALEIAYSHAPEHMKAMIQAIFPLMAGIGSACAMGISPLAHDPYLVIFYASLASGMAVVTAVFWFIFRKHDKGSEDAISENHEDIEQSSPSEIDHSRGSVGNIEPRPGNDDVELGIMSSKRATTGSDLTGSTIVSGEISSVDDIAALRNT